MSEQILSVAKAIKKDVAHVNEQIGKLEPRLDAVEKALNQPDYHRNRLPAEARDPREAARNGFSTPREYLLAVQNFFTKGNLDNRLKSLRVTKSAGADEQSGANDAYGGFLLPVGFSPEILKVDPEDDPIGSLTRKVPMDRSIIKIPARVDKNHQTSVSGGLRVYRREDTTDITASRQEYEQISLEAHNLAGAAYATEELLMDSPQSFAALIASGFEDQFTSHMIDERINGNGAGCFLGIMNSPALISVSKETGQAADTITYQNVLKMRSRCWGYKNAVWLANHDTMPQLMTLNQLFAASGAIVWQPSAREDHPDILLGRPLIFTEYTKTLGDAGDIILVNWKEYLEGTYQPMQTAESIHVRFLQHERAFKFWTRNAGQPWWRSALTPKNSSTTLSPYVALAERA